MGSSLRLKLLAPNSRLAADAARRSGRFEPRYRRCGLPPAFRPALRAGHHAAAADGCLREHARAFARRSVTRSPVGLARSRRIRC